MLHLVITDNTGTWNFLLLFIQRAIKLIPIEQTRVIEKQQRSVISNQIVGHVLHHYFLYALIYL